MRLTLGFSDDIAWVWSRTIDTKSLLITTSVRPTAQTAAGTTEEVSIGRAVVPMLHQALRVSSVDQWPRITSTRPGKVQPDRLWTVALSGTDTPVHLKVPFPPPDWTLMEQALCRLAGAPALGATGPLQLSLKVAESHGSTLELKVEGPKIELIAGAGGKTVHKQEKALRRTDIGKVEETLDRVGAWGWMPYYLDRLGSGAKSWALTVKKGKVVRDCAGKDRMPEGFAELLDRLTQLALA